jgi:hypothetical protein
VKVPFFKKLSAADFPDQPWIAKLLASFGDFLDQLRVGLNKGFTFADNIDCELREFALNQRDFPYSFVPKKKPSHLVLTYCVEQGPVHVNLTLGAPDWDNVGNGMVTVYGIPGMNTGKDYVVRFLLWE